MKLSYIFVLYKIQLTTNMPSMKYLSLFKIVIIFSIIGLLFSCNNEDISKITAIQLISTPSDQVVGENFVFKVEANNSTDVTTEATITVDGNVISNNTFSSLVEGDYVVIADYDGIKSNSITISNNIQTGYSQKVLVEDYTGTWCGYCPRVAYAIEKLKLESNKVVPVAIHLYSNNDIFNFDVATTIANEFIPAGGLPKAQLNRITKWNSPQQERLSEALNLTGFNAPLGLAINSTLTGSTIDLEIKVGFGITFTNPLKLVVYLVEDGLMHNQTNYTQGLFTPNTNPLLDFEHNEVLRAVYTDYLGDVISNTLTIDGSIATINFNKTLPTSVVNSNKLSFIAFVTNANTKEVINVQSAHIGENKDFD